VLRQHSSVDCRVKRGNDKLIASSQRRRLDQGVKARITPTEKNTTIKEWLKPEITESEAGMVGGRHVRRLTRGCPSRHDVPFM
jgi:hypothetical protein